MAHETITIGHPTSPQQSPVSHAKIYYRLDWGATWTELPHAVLNYVLWACSPNPSRAQFTMRYGRGLQPGDSVATTYAPIDLNRLQVKIELSYESLPEAPGTWMVGATWYGEVDMQAAEEDGLVDSTYESGEQVFVAYGFELLLERHTVNWSLVFGYSDDIVNQSGDTITGQDGGGNIASQPKPFQVNHGIAFNADGRGNQSQFREEGDNKEFYRFAYNPNGQPRWSTREIVKYLVRGKAGVPEFPPRVFPDVPWPFPVENTWEWRIDDAELEMLPDWDAPEIETHMVSAKQLLDTLISRRRLMTWFVEVSEPGTAIHIRVRTFTNADLQLGPPGSTIPANDDQISIDVSASAASNCVIQTDTSHTYDQVIAYGAQLTSTFTTRLQQAGVSVYAARPASAGHTEITGLLGKQRLADCFVCCIEPDWTSSQEAAYVAGGKDDGEYPPITEPDLRKRYRARKRSSEALASVFRTWRLRRHGFPQVLNKNVFFADVELRQELPLFGGLDYSGGRIANGTIGINDIATNDPAFGKFRPHMVIVPVLDNYDEHAPSQVGRQVIRYARLDSLGGEQNMTIPAESAQVQDWTCSVNVPQDGRHLQIDVAGAPQDTIAWSHFYGANAPANDEPAEQKFSHGLWNFDDMVATVCCQYGDYLQASYPVTENLQSETMTRILRIAAGDNYRRDHVEPFTLVDVVDGEPTFSLTGGYVRDDYEKLQAIARQAYYWYSTSRVACRIRTVWDRKANDIRRGRYVYQLVQPGALAKSVGAIITEVMVESQGSRVSQRTHGEAMPPMLVTFNTAFGELDYMRLREPTVPVARGLKTGLGGQDSNDRV